MSSLARLVPTTDELREMVRLAAPVVLVNLGTMLQGTVDTIVLGHYSSVALAAGAIGNLYFFGAIVFGMGLLMSLDPVVAQALGAGDAEAAARGVQRGVVLAVASAAVGGAIMWPAGALLRAMHQPADVIPGAVAYVRWSILGVVPWLVFTAFRQTLQAMHRVLFMALAVIIANVLNAGLNWVFVFGHLGFPRMGVVGSAHATWISRWVMLGLVVWFSWPYLRETLVPWRRASFAPAPLLRMIAIGAPVGFQLCAEGFAFGFAGLVMGSLGAVTLSGHQISLTLAALTYMVPLGVAGAGAAMVGRAIGAGDLPEARRDAAAALVCGAGFMAIMAVCFIAMPALFAGAFTNDPATIAMVLLLLPIAGVFQVFDGTQVISAAILRAAGDTRVPMVLHILSFWALGIPLGLTLCFRAGFGAPGMWWGLTAGLASAALLQVARVRSHLRTSVARIRVEDSAGNAANGIGRS